MTKYNRQARKAYSFHSIPTLRIFTLQTIYNHNVAHAMAAQCHAKINTISFAAFFSGGVLAHLANSNPKTEMTTVDMNSSSQVEAILAQIYHTSRSQDWRAYITHLWEVLVDQNRVSYQGLHRWLDKHSVIQLFHRMLEQELTTESQRTLPHELAGAYPWAATPMEVVEAYLNFALRRDDLISRPKDAVSAYAEVISIIKAELEQPVQEVPVIIRENELARALAPMQIDDSHSIIGSRSAAEGNQTLDQKLDDYIEEQELLESVHSMQLN